ncbi:hypothetical protein FHS31_001997 [Sphingomonas vulcanisoli]|uniref:Uncharacterized protein n=1 Tax=Sphingomonas vulcanisoli TaxID=1658060 RepID=A0ABX0TX69_9SPHN|nr:hypothetical protein [Sphingomonas vulcanisoli]NIJ08380.1 hypothetical protein [Sphingomonas vulcanisoli]
MHRRTAEKAGAGSDQAEAAAAPEPRHHAAPPPFVAGVTVSDPGTRSRPKLCKDLKGLFTPCPR